MAPMGDATIKRSERAKKSSAPELGGLTARLPLPPRGAVDSILLEYLNKPTAPSMEAVRLPIAAYSAAPRVALSGVPTCPPDEQLNHGESGTFVSPAHGVPQIAEESLEDERPTGQWAISQVGNPLELVRDRGVLVRLDGDASGEVISLPREPIIVGRSSRAHVHIAEPSVSREHARIVYEYGAYYAVDGGSQNGTMVAGRKIMRAELRDGDLVQFGQRSTYRFSLMDQTQEQVMRRLFESSTRDPLTGADNRRNMESRLQSEIAFAERHKRPLSVILLDIDFFKSVNDRYGHPAGDEVLKSVAAVVRGQLRTEDAFARYGGEEFVIVLRDTTLAQAALVADRVREKIGKSSVALGGPDGVTLTVTASAGCASLACSVVASTEELIGVADRRLYRAKRGGRNRVVAKDESIPAVR
jgi:two-component system cell cycle response regulator